eukprot:7873124-Ditylum_brightwellii.AAC.1
MARAKSKTKGKSGKIVSFGSSYKQYPFNYFKRDFLQEQGQCNCICIDDCNTTDEIECNQAKGDSGLESNYYTCTSIHPGEYKACKGTETDLKTQCINNKHLKCSQ